MTEPMQVRMIGVTIRRPWRQVYDFAAEPRNMPRWASGLGAGLRHEEGAWIADGPEGPVRVRFSERNPFGVLDHRVVLAPGVEILVPMRVLPNGDGAEVQLVLFRQPGVTDERFAADADWVARDLDALKRLLEAMPD
ncbi:polyketide cyclase [Marinibaculum pumilum]|uniref:Polyketide cyclase n=1 Tax=Marinibaculum pumilum TaxID=1766165 RepID=A0ABV7KUU3_9PROT